MFPAEPAARDGSAWASRSLRSPCGTVAWTCREAARRLTAELREVFLKGLDIAEVGSA